jgi:hypothetical protein
MKNKHLKLLYFATFAGVIVFTIVTTTYLFQNKKCHIVFENRNMKFTDTSTQVTAYIVQYKY